MLQGRRSVALLLICVSHFESDQGADQLEPCVFFAVSPLLLTSDLVSRTQLVLSSSLAASSSLYAFHPETSASTVFLTGADLAKYLSSLGQIAQVDFEALKADTPAPAPSTGEKKPAKSAQDRALADKKRKDDAKIKDADELAIGVYKELDFPEWYRRVLVKGEMIECVPFSPAEV